MKFLDRLAAAAVALVLCNSALAQDTAKAPLATPTEASVRAAVQERLGQRAEVGTVRLSPAGLWEVQVGKDVLYTDGQANYLFVGKLIDLRTREDLTQARLDNINRIDFKILPLDLAMKSVRGKGERVVAVFADPNCGFCKRFEQTVAALDNVTIYTFLYPILSEDSTKKSRQIWCSSNRQKTWEAWMVEGKTPAGKADCDTPIDRLTALGSRLEITGTPTLFFADGRRVVGAIPIDQIEAHLRRSAAKQ